MFNKIINVSGVTKLFGEINALKDVDFQVSKGEIFGYVGPNGAGKTTTIRILLGLMQPSQGQVSVLGFNPYLDGNKEKALRKRIGFMLDMPGLFPHATAYRNLMYYAKIYNIAKPDMRIKAVLEQVGLWERREGKVEDFSHGMLQRLSFARAILHDPELLILDEPTSGLDPTFQKLFRDFLVDSVSCGKKTIFISSHNLFEIQQICKKIGIISKGKIIAKGDLKSLRAQYPSKLVEIRLGNGYNKKFKQNLCQQIEKLPFVQTCQNRQNLLSIELEDLSASSAINEFLVNKGLAVKEIKIREYSLEEIYEMLVKS